MKKCFGIAFILMILFTSILFAQQEAMVITPEGFVGVNTTSPTEYLEINGNTKVHQNLTVEGSATINGAVHLRDGFYTDEAYKDWAVGQYYSIPADQRTEGFDIYVANLPTSWTEFDLSSLLPYGVKRIRVYISALGNDNPSFYPSLWFYARPYGNTATLSAATELGRVNVGDAGDTSIAELGWEAEIDVSPDGKFELCDDPARQLVSAISINLRGFYK